jgi:CrcB protein
VSPSGRLPQGRAVALVALGGAAGAVLRYALSAAFPDGAGHFPWTVFAINVAGCGVLALLPALAVVRRRASLAALLGPGVLGGFTTLSTYGEQSRALLAQGHALLAGCYVIGTLLAALLAVLAADRLSSPGQRTAFADEGGDE